MKLRLAIGDLRFSIGIRCAAVSGFCVCAFGVSAFGQSGGDFVIKKRVLAAGCGLMMGGDYRINGTAGQHDAGLISGGDVVVYGGFWSPRVEDSSPPTGLVPDPSTLNKTRFISFSAVGTPGQFAIRVHLTSLHDVVPPYSGGTTTSFDAFEGESLWVGQPVQYAESTSAGAPQFYAAQLQCTPHYRNWGTVGLLHVTGSAVVPSSLYRGEMLAVSCQGVEDSAACQPGGANVSAQLDIRTTRWGDVRTPYNPPDASIQPDISDVSALVDKFRNALGAPIKARAIQAGVAGNPWGDVTAAQITVDLQFSHISACVDAFRGLSYPYKMGKCAGAPTPPATGACTSDSECVGNNGAPPCNLYCP